MRMFLEALQVAECQYEAAEILPAEFDMLSTNDSFQCVRLKSPNRCTHSSGTLYLASVGAPLDIDQLA